MAFFLVPALTKHPAQIDKVFLLFLSGNLSYCEVDGAILLDFNLTALSAQSKYICSATG